MGNRSFSKVGQLLVLASGIGLLLFGFNNCGRVGSAISEAELQSDLATKVVTLKQMYQGVLEAGFCENSVNYSCNYKVFSPQIASEKQNSSSECVTLLQGGELCPLVQSFAYNSQVAKDSCRENCSESFDYSEYDCHIKLEGSTAKTYPIVVTEAKLSEAVQRLYELCTQIQQGNNNE